MKKTYKFIMLGLATFAVLNGYISSASCDLTSYIHNYSTDTEFQMDSNITWDEVNSVTNTGEDYQVLSGVRASTLKQYFTSDEILEGYALGKVSQKRVCTIYCSEPEYFAGLQAVAATYPDYEHLYKKAQGKAPTTVVSASEVDSSTNDEELKIDTSASNTKSKEKNEKPATYSDDEIAAAWEETEKVESTCTKEGYVEYKNTLTGDTKTEALELANHDYDESSRVEATCKNEGLVTYTCKVCGDTYSEKIYATGHDEGKWTTTKKAGLFTKGLEQRLCTKCDEVLEEREINAIISLPIAILVGCLAIITIIILALLLKKKMKKE